MPEQDMKEFHNMLGKKLGEAMALWRDERLGHPVKCDCCQTETMAVITGNRLVIKDKRHGRQHVAVVLLDKVEESCNTQDCKLNTDA